MEFNENGIFKEKKQVIEYYVWGMLFVYRFESSTSRPGRFTPARYLGVHRIGGLVGTGVGLEDLDNTNVTWH